MPCAPLLGRSGEAKDLVQKHGISGLTLQTSKEDRSSNSLSHFLVRARARALTCPDACGGGGSAHTHLHECVILRVTVHFLLGVGVDWLVNAGALLSLWPQH